MDVSGSGPKRTKFAILDVPEIYLFALKSNMKLPSPFKN
jgi:hypothetical protein